MILQKLPVLVLHVNNRCNCRCVMCSIWKSTDETELTPQTLDNLLPDIRTLGVENVIFTGGEPLMNPHLPDLCAILKECGVRITVLTTGLLLSRHAASLTQFVDEVIVSLDGPREVHDRIRRVVGGYDLLSNGVQAIHAIASDFAVSGRCTVQKSNHTALRQTVDAAQAIGLKSISFLAADMTSTTFNRSGPLSIVEASTLALSLEEIKALNYEIQKLVCERSNEFAAGFIAESPQKLQRIPHHFLAHLGLADPISPRCNAPWTSAVIETDGTLRPCFFHRGLGNAQAAGLTNVLNSRPATYFRSQLKIENDPMCRRCVCSLYR